MHFTEQTGAWSVPSRPRYAPAPARSRRVPGACACSVYLPCTRSYILTRRRLFVFRIPPFRFGMSLDNVCHFINHYCKEQEGVFFTSLRLGPQQSPYFTSGTAHGPSRRRTPTRLATRTAHRVVELANSARAKQYMFACENTRDGHPSSYPSLSLPTQFLSFRADCNG